MPPVFREAHLELLHRKTEISLGALLEATRRTNSSRTPAISAGGSLERSTVKTPEFISTPRSR
jgi:hypothetical protein